MKIMVTIPFGLCLALSTYGNPEWNKKSLHFLENKGQIIDQYKRPRTDINALVHTNGVTAFIGSGAIHYQFYRNIDDKKAIVATQRLDVVLQGANKNATAIMQERQPYYERYYMPQFGEQGAMAYSYNKILYKDIYPGIDWLLYIKENQLEHEFIVHEGGDPNQIKIQYNGATALSINEDGNFHGHTPMGEIIEAKPYCYNEAGKSITAKYKLDDNILSFDIAPYTGTLTIDPTVIWGTYYYGATNSLQVYDLETKSPEHIYMVGGLAYCEGLATLGAYQDTINAGQDGFIVKFDSSGNRVWCTYYGGSDIDAISSIAIHVNGDIYICGDTRSSDAMATSGSHQTIYGDSTDAFIAKFSSLGERIWSTYLGGNKQDVAYSIKTAPQRVYISGNTKSTTGIATINAHQTVMNGMGDHFVAVFDTGGTRHWATYYGGSASEGTLSNVYPDQQGNIYLSGYTGSDDNIATPGSHQSTKEPAVDGYLVKFNSGGTRLWATYYGGEGADQIFGLVCDNDDNVYISGATGLNQGTLPGSTYNISTSNGLQPAPGGGIDLFIAKFSPSGERLWGTYYGDTGIENATRNSLSIDQWNNLYLSGETTSPAIQGQQYLLQSIPGASSGLILKLDSSGQQLWASYYGGTGVDRVSLSSPDNIGNVYFAGRTTSDSNIATPDGFLPIDTMIGGTTTFLVRIYDTLPPLNIKEATSEDQLFIYPNPSTGVIITESAYAAECSMFGVDGRRLMALKIKKGRTIINLSGYPHGMYFISCRWENGTVVTKNFFYTE